MFETRAGIIFIAGIGFFLLAFLASGLVPVIMYQHLPELTVEQFLEKYPNSRRNMSYQLGDLAKRFEISFEKYVGKLAEKRVKTPDGKEAVDRWVPPEKEVEWIAGLLRRGRKVYVGEACWHCHSQFVRPVANEERRYGPVSKSWEYQNELQRPVMFGTRRVGPDLSREGGRRSSDWHAVHFFEPYKTGAETVMPAYPWFFDGQPDRPNERGLALILYVQWLGSALPNYSTAYRPPASWTGEEQEAQP